MDHPIHSLITDQITLTASNEDDAASDHTTPYLNEVYATEQFRAAATGAIAERA